MSLGRGKNIEDNLLNSAGMPQAITTTDVYWNGTTTTGSTGIDTQGWDEVIWVLQAGIVEAAGSMAAAIWHSATDNADAAAAITSASFTAVTPSNHRSNQHGYIKCKNYLRYQWLRTVNANATSVTFAGGAILSRGDRGPASNSPVFDLNW